LWKSEVDVMRLWRRATGDGPAATGTGKRNRKAKTIAGGIGLALVAAALGVISFAPAAQACVVDADGDCYLHVTGTVWPSNGLNIHSGSPTGAVFDVLPYNYSNNTDCYTTGPVIHGNPYWDSIWDSRAGRTGWVSDYYLYTGGNIYNQVDSLSEGNCG
jgi:hypothetical protein